MHFQCPSCSSKFTRRRNLLKHFTTKHNDYPNAGITCFLCGQMFKNDRYLDEHNKRYNITSRYYYVNSSFRIVYSTLFSSSKSPLFIYASARFFFLSKFNRQRAHHFYFSKSVMKILLDYPIHTLFFK